MASSSPTTTTKHATLTRRLSARRGSLVASDPFGEHLALNTAPHRASFSSLTIVRVPQDQADTASTDILLKDPPTVPRLARRPHPGHGPHRRHGSAGAATSGNGGPDSSPRMSFAFSSFSRDGPSTSPNTSPRLGPSSPTTGRRPSSPTMHRANLGGLAGRPKLAPEEVVELAKQAATPHTPATGSPSGLSLSPRFGGSPVITPGGVDLGGSVERATFVPMADDVYLPFVDRPEEVKALMSGPPCAKLFALLKQTFPKADPTSVKEQNDVLPENPAKWTYAQLMTHLARPRTAIPDATWAARARTCVRAHSELIWERIKGAWGVPPELDCPEDELPVHLDISVEWDREDIEAGPGAITPSATTSGGETITASPIESSSPAPLSPLALPTSPSHVSPSHLSPSLLATESLSIEHLYATPAPPEATSPGHRDAPPPAQGGAELQGIGEEDEEQEEQDKAESDTPRRGNTQEQEQEQEQEAKKTPPPVHGLRLSTVPQPTAPPSIAHPLRSPTLSRHSHSSDSGSHSRSSGSIHGQVQHPQPHPLPSPNLDVLSGPDAERDVPGIMIRQASAQDPTKDDGAADEPQDPPMSVSPSGTPPTPNDHEEEKRSAAAVRRSSSIASWYGNAGHDAVGGPGGYDPVGDRAPGNPLFPSSFARLAVGPTLSANNPALRAAAFPPQPAYGANPHAIRAATMPVSRRTGRPVSWAAGWDLETQEYAISATSTSSFGGSDRGG